MLDVDLFLNRLELLMENHKLNAAAFAEKIGVQRSSVSHILSRRNKPSLDFILKIESQFEEADFNWLLLGTQNKTSSDPELFDKVSFKSSVKNVQIKNGLNLSTEKYNLQNNDSEVTQIIQTYKDGSFRVFLPKT